MFEAEWVFSPLSRFLQFCFRKYSRFTDALQFATRLSNTFVIGQGSGSKPLVTLPKGKGVKLTIAEERDRRLEKAKTA